MTERNEYRVVLVLPITRQILVRNDGGTFRLPRISIPNWTRPAQKVNEAIDERWHIGTVVIDFLTGGCTQPACVVLEVRTRKWTGIDLVPQEAYRVSSCDLSDHERAELEEIILGNCGVRGPFSRLGWIDEAQEWIRSAVCDRTVNFTNQTHQLNASGSFALLRFETAEPPAYWLKAVGGPNTHEFSITTNLARVCPDYLPRLVCARPDWNAWVMEDCGDHLQSPVPFSLFERVVTRFAEMQVSLLGKVEELLEFGCVDQRISVLELHLSDLTEYLDQIMQRQTSTKVPRLETHRLHELEDILRVACSRMKQLGIPDSLIHNDINPGNVLRADSRCVFTDWCEACVGNPFLTCEHLCAQISREDDPGHTWAPLVKDAYKRLWLAVFDESSVDRALALAPLLALISHLSGRRAWLMPRHSNDTRFHSYARGMARRIDRVAKDPHFLEALCH